MEETLFGCESQLMALCAVLDLTTTVIVLRKHHVEVLLLLEIFLQR